MPNIGARRQGPTPRPRVTRRVESPPVIRKEDAPCCQARRDELDRLPIGYCSAGCVRRPVQRLRSTSALSRTERMAAQMTGSRTE